MKAVLLILWCAVFVIATADQLGAYAQQSAATHCAYAGFQSSKYCPPIAGFTFSANTTKAPHSPQGFPVLPAMIGLGYNPVTKRIGLPASGLSYAAGAVWTSTQGVKFAVPDQVLLSPSVVTTPQTQQFHYEDYHAYFSEAISAYDGNCVGGMFVSSQNIEAMYDQYFSGRKSLTVNQEYHTMFTLSLKSAPIDPIAAAAIAWLPAAYNQALYFEFIEFWGTHFIASASFGGMAEVIVETSLCLNTLLTPAIIQQMVLYDTQNVLYPGSVPNSKYDARYLSSRRISSIDMVGGNPELATIAQWQQRIASFENDPVALHFTYQPISNLVADPTKRANMARAMQEYLAAGAATANSQKVAVDALDYKSFMAPQTISAIFWSQGGTRPYAERMCPMPGIEVKVSGGCYRPPYAEAFASGAVAPGGVLSEANIGVLCKRDPTTGFVSSATATSNWHAATPPVSMGCAVSQQVTVWSNSLEYLWCCQGAGIAIHPVPGENGKTGQAPTMTCSPI